MSTSTALKPIDHLRQTIEGPMKAEVTKALPAHVNIDRFNRVALTALNSNPDIVNAERKSVLASVMKAAQDGLMLDGREAAIVVFNTKSGKIAQYMPMVAGVMKKMRNSGQLSSIAAHVVYERDFFDYELGDTERVVHKPTLVNRGQPVAVYAVAHLKDGSIQREVMSVEEVEAIRARSRSGKAGPWVTDWSEMARKTVIRRIAKYLPSSSDLDRLLEADDEANGPTDIPPRTQFRDVTPPPDEKPAAKPGPRTSRLQTVVDNTAAQDVEEVIDEPEYDPETGEVDPPDDATDDDVI